MNDSPDILKCTWISQKEVKNLLIGVMLGYKKVDSSQRPGLGRIANKLSRHINFKKRGEKENEF